MSKTSWPKIRIRKYQWQDKNGTVSTSTSYQINCRLPNGKRFQQTFKDRKDAESVATRLRDERTVELKNRTVSLHNLNIKNMNQRKSNDTLSGINNFFQKSCLTMVTERLLYGLSDHRVYRNRTFAVR